MYIVGPASKAKRQLQISSISDQGTDTFFHKVYVSYVYRTTYRKSYVSYVYRTTYRKCQQSFVIHCYLGAGARGKIRSRPPPDDNSSSGDE